MRVCLGLGVQVLVLVLTRAEVGFDGRIHKDPPMIKSCFDAACVHWNDTDGNRIEAHGAGMVQVCQCLVLPSGCFKHCYVAPHLL